MISVDKVYKMVLAVLNKEQRGYLTPSQFNKFGRQAQLEILEKTFYDYNRQLTKRNIQGVNSEYGDIADNLEEKIDSLSKSVTLNNLDYTNIYKVIQLTTTDRGVEIEKVKKSEYTYLISSPLTAPTASYPVYYWNGNAIVVSNSISTSDVTVDYIKLPADPIWNYNVNSGAYEYTSIGSQNFELHASQEQDLVVRILSYAGVVVKDPNVIQMAQATEVNNFNQENA